MYQQIDRLAAYDSEAIVREFSPHGPVEHGDRRYHDNRRAALRMADWKESLSDSQRIPKNALKNTCRFETNRVRHETLFTLILFVVLLSAAGIFCALAIKHLNFFS